MSGRLILTLNSPLLAVLREMLSTRPLPEWPVAGEYPDESKLKPVHSGLIANDQLTATDRFDGGFGFEEEVVDVAEL